MTTKQELVNEWSIMTAECDDFIHVASMNGGMHLEARVKLLENQLVSALWFIDKLIKKLPDE